MRRGAIVVIGYTFYMTQNKIYIYGKHAVTEALTSAPQAVLKVHLAKTLEDPKLRELVRRAGVPTEVLDPRRVTSQVEGNAPHQGVVALISLAGITTPFKKFIAEFSPNPDTLVVLQSEVQDPHNVGAIIRSAAAFGAAAVLMPNAKQAPVSGAVVRASAGMAFRVPLVVLDNMQQAIAELKKKGFVVYGLAAQSKHPVAGEPFAAPALMIFGNEAHGVAPAARALCDTMLSIPMSPRAESLNVAASAAVALYAWSLRHAKAL